MSFHTARSYATAGLCVLPAKLDPKMPDLPAWKPYQKRLPTEDELHAWFVHDRPLCVLTGKPSGNLEVIDFDLHGELFDRWSGLICEQAPELLERLVVERSQSGGRHVLYRAHAPVGKSLKLAMREVPTPDEKEVIIGGKRYKPRKRKDGTCAIDVTLIETRGDGGLVVCSPSPGYELLAGSFERLPVLNEDERDILLGSAWSLNEKLPAPEATPTLGDASGRPGDDFNDRGDVASILIKYGWTLARSGDNEYWRRPGKTTGWSATLKKGVFYVFSSNAGPFEPERAYRAFAVYAILEHGGDFSRAAAALLHDGYGVQGDKTNGVDLSGLLPASGNGKPSEPRAIVHQLCTVERQTLHWLWPGRIPLGKLSLLAGDPGLGKSIVTLDMTARVSRSLPWPDVSLLEQPIASVVLFNAEDDLADTIAPRLDKAGADGSRVFVVEGVEQWKPDKEQPIRWYFSLENVGCFCRRSSIWLPIPTAWLIASFKARWTGISTRSRCMPTKLLWPR